MIPENIINRVGRLISGIAHVAIDKAEGSNRLAVVQQAIREIEDAEATAQADLAQARAAEYRLNARRGEVDAELATLAEKIRTAIAEKRDDLARSGVARQLDLEAQQEVLAKTHCRQCRGDRDQPHGLASGAIRPRGRRDHGLSSSGRARRQRPRRAR